MRQSKYTIFFTDGEVKTFTSLNMFGAVIKAIHYKLDNAQDSTIETVKTEKGLEYRIKTNIEFEKIV